MEQEKRMAGDYEVYQALRIGRVEVVLGIDMANTEKPYLVCYCSQNNLFGIDQYYGAEGFADYLVAMQEFNKLLQWEIEKLQTERSAITEPMLPIQLAQCLPIKSEDDLMGRIVVVRTEWLRPEFRTADNQLIWVTGGFGASGNSRGRAVYAETLYTGDEYRYNREDLMGFLNPAHTPTWATEKLAQRQAEQAPSKPRSRGDAR
ncbi:hypothetical protein BSK66_24800 [Paenibacillus odorifer]|uniref:hypothetical protein n=1 Tax=Paenibacillus TaxID=44249 RepID=UPI0003E28A8A|nr:MULTISPECIES: hypothetical protein [Paenibacillus]ETT61788.1 hypothetical protein C171_11711 [Paenibacillus sp. FSL H8-237]OME50687.1 hypothetical protein BSK66_24800 [Paenibacillus odorifer]SIR49644.1 hypothetical protein SAMN05880555_3984 [Paenibacillus sp. RU4X]SIR58704.1 hypothetical protein SAMN05880570_3987 [Paenibacillus sp. RU4T]